jgi:hypothetical protein
LRVVYSNCTTAKTGLPLTPVTVACPGQQRGAVRAVGEELALEPATELSMIGLLLMS